MTLNQLIVLYLISTAVCLIAYIVRKVHSQVEQIKGEHEEPELVDITFVALPFVPFLNTIAAAVFICRSAQRILGIRKD